MQGERLWQGVRWGAISAALVLVVAVIYWIHRTHTRYATRPPRSSVYTLILRDPASYSPYRYKQITRTGRANTVDGTDRAMGTGPGSSSTGSARGDGAPETPQRNLSTLGQAIALRLQATTDHTMEGKRCPAARPRSVPADYGAKRIVPISRERLRLIQAEIRAARGCPGPI